MPPAQKPSKPSTKSLSEYLKDEEPKVIGMRWFFDARAINPLPRDQEVTPDLIAAEILTRIGLVEKHERLIPGFAKVIADAYCD